MIFDCSDNPETKYILNSLSHKFKKILFQVPQFKWKAISDLEKGLNKDYPCYECIFPRTNEKAPITNCRDSGIIGPLTGLIGCMQVNEAIKEIAVKDYQSTAGNLFLFDGLTLNLDKIKLVKNYQCPICSN